MSEPLKRRLAVIAAFDVVGYSRLMEADEEDTHRRMKDILRDVVSPLLARHGGRLVKSTGDGGLVEFQSVVEGAKWALATQRQLAAANETEPPPRRIEMRIGVSLGDIIIEPDDIYGEGVNIAARLQAVAEPGGICLTQHVVEQLRGKIDGRFLDLGEPKLKNMNRVVRIFRLVDDDQPAPSEDTPVPGVNVSTSVSGFRERPAIVVLPLRTLSAGSEPDYFADGLTEDLTTALAGWHSFPVISRNSAFAYKERNIDAKEIGRELGARYVVEGSVRRHDASVRVTVQLVEAETGYQIFADHYNREGGSILSLQDEIATNIVGALEPELLRVERERSSTSANSFAAYDLMQRGLWHHYRRTSDDSKIAQTLFRNAIEVDPQYAQAIAALSVCLSQSFMSGWTTDREAVISEALELGRRAAFLDARDPLTHFSLGLASLHGRQIPLAIGEMEAAIRLNPSYAAAYTNLSNLYNYTGRAAEALEMVTRSLRLSPNDPRIFLWMPALAGSHYLMANYDKAIEAGRYGLAIKPDYVHALRYVAAALGQLGRNSEAEAAVADLRRFDGSLSRTEAFLADYYVDKRSLLHILDGLQKAGFD